LSKIFNFSFIPYIALPLAFLLLPNLALVLGGFHGFYVTYSALALLTALSLPLVAQRRGLNSLDAYTSASIALTLVTLFTVLGFLWGFASRTRLDPLSLSVSLGLFLVQILSTEISRSLVLGLVRRRTLSIVLGILTGLFIGRTLPAVVTYVSGLGAPMTLLSLLNDVAFNLAVTLVHVYGGFAAAASFRLVLDGYWRFSPLVLDTSGLGVVWTATSTLTYYGLALYLFYRTPTLRELSSSSRLKLRKASTRLKSYILQVATYIIVLAVLASIYLRVVPLVIVSGSMEPTLDVGDLVLVRISGPVNLSVGSLIAFRLNSTIVVHRLVGVEGDRLITKGDANPEPDPFQVRRESLVGVVVGKIPKVGLLALAIQGSLRLSEYLTVPVLVVAVTASLAAALAKRRSRNKLLLS
jgi:signal peptidase